MIAENTIQTKQPRSPFNWDQRLLIGSLVIFAIALGLRLWHLDTIEYPVFDEVYFPKHAEEYLTATPFRDGHPPLAKYLIAVTIMALGHNPWGYRLASAIVGAIIPLLAIGVAYRFSGKWRLALITGALTVTDGLFLVESRFGLINVFLVAFGLAALVLSLAALERKGITRTLYLTSAGIMLGASAAAKWNGLGFWLMSLVLVALVWVNSWLKPELCQDLGILDKIKTLDWWQYLLWLAIAPALFYELQWLPHIILYAPTLDIAQLRDNPNIANWLVYTWRSFVAFNQDIWDYNHNSAVMGMNSHPYCSSWLSWPIASRPIGYYYHYVEETKHVIDVHAIGNPVLWWFSTLAIITLTAQGLRRFRAMDAYVLIGYSANYLPWLLVSRCLFIYHYMSAAVFSFMALAILLDRLLPEGVSQKAGLAESAESAELMIETNIETQTEQNAGEITDPQLIDQKNPNKSNLMDLLLKLWARVRNVRSQWWRYGAFAIIILAVVGTQIFFMPIWLGIDISFEAFYHRMWSRYVPLNWFNWI
ncbi:glycosyl transferase family 39 [Thalassoporum mexicanum PCC 7367]|uniref:phospholipid carrier-dependent glycosyltransferase n=1 Tax=Thalassoporum mexicanum TaxID=3457544 RepID=UPI00029F8E3E|nr:phospholipid carrier-dependent glycosyltransferase [Pseudanabaena sp. PCC 7367]AFY69346.1 glycosyl transferase family 39 [Pseudanabaena sp. PCC 7367]